jgi:hypothetical protein
VKVFDHIAFPESSFERLEHFGANFPVFISTDATRDFRLLDANVSDNSDGFVIVSQIVQRRPVLIVLRK